MSRTTPLTLNDLGMALYGRPAWSNDHPISGVIIDSRQAAPGSVFVALPGEHTDGHLFVQDAFKRGAIAALVERLPSPGDVPFSLFDPQQPVDAAALPVCFQVSSSMAALQQWAAWQRRQFEVRVVGITGSVGKTTTKEMVAAVMSTRYRVLKSQASYNNELGLPLTLLELNAQHERLILEMGTFGPGEIAQLATMSRPWMGIVTNVGPVHLERMGTLERIAQAKAELPQSLPADGIAILNADDERVRGMAAQTQARVFWYGLTPGCDLWADQVQSSGLGGVRFQFHQADRDGPWVQLPTLGQHSVYTALRAAAAGLMDGLCWDEMIGGLQTVQPIRLIAKPGLNNSTVLDDSYNSSPDTAISALNVLQELEGRKIAVLGDMLELGSYADEGHRRVGEKVAQVASLLITVGPLGRQIGQTALCNGLRPDQVVSLADNQAAIAYLSDHIGPGDVILIKGSRGIRMEQIVRALTRPS